MGSMCIASSLKKLIQGSQFHPKTLKAFTSVMLVINTCQACLLLEELDSSLGKTSSDGVGGLLGTLHERPRVKMVKATMGK